MLAEVGVKFGAQGIEVTIQQLTAAHRAFSGLSTGVDQATAAVRKAETNLGGSFGRIAKHAEMMHSGLKASFGLAKSAVLGFVGGVAAQKLANWGTGGHGASDMWKDYLRIFGATEKGELGPYSKHLRDLRRRIPGIGGEDYYESMFQIRSLMGPSAEMNTKAAEAVAILGKTLSPTGTMNQAMDYLQSMVAAYGVGKGPAEKLDIIERIAAMTKVALSEKLVKGHHLEVAAPQIASLYAGAGRSYADLLSDLATAGEVVGPRAGELVRNIFSKSGEGFSKVTAALAKERLLAARGFQYEFQVPEDKKAGLAKIVKGVEEYSSRHAAKLLATGQIQQYNVELKRITENLLALGKKRGVDTAKVVNDAFGETASQIMPHLLRAWTEGGQQKFKERLEGVIPKDELRGVEDSFVSLAARSKLFDQQLSDLWGSTRKLFSPAINEILKSWGSDIDRVTDSIVRLTEGSDVSMQRFISSFKGAYAQAVGGIDAGLVDWIQQLINNLALGEEGWARLGAQSGETLGKIAANLRDVAKSAGDVAASINAIAAPFRALGAVGDWLGNIGRSLGAKHFEAEKAIGGGLFDPRYNRLLARSFPGLDVAAKLWGLYGGGSGEAAPTLERAHPSRPELRPPALWGGPGGFVPKGGLEPHALGPVIVEPNVQLDPQIEVILNVDGERLEAHSRTRILRENARHRRGYGDNALGFGHP